MSIQMLLRKFPSTDYAIAIVLLGSAFLAGALLIQVSACSLCMTQRLFMVCGVASVAISLVHNQPKLIYSIVAGLFWLAGCIVAFRQLWIQYVPGAATNCGPGIDFLIANEYPFSSIVKTMLTGSGDCAEPSIIPLLALGGFVVLLGLLTLQVWATRRENAAA